MSKAAVAICTSLIVTAIASGCTGTGARHVVVVKAHQATIDAQPGGLGQTAAAIDLPIPLGFSATIDSAAVQPGDHVTKGQSLLTASPVSSPTAARQARTKLLGDQAAAQAAVAAMVQHRTAEAIAAAQARLAAANARIGLDNELLQIAEGRLAPLTSPIDGIVASVAATGALLSRSKPAVELIDYSHVLVTVSLPIEDQSTVAAGQHAEATFNELPGVSLTGTVVSVAPVAVNNGQSFQLVVNAPNTPTEQVRPGFIAFVKVTARKLAAVAVSGLCVLNRADDPTVFVVDGRNAYLRHVIVGASDSQLDEIISGVRDGDLCVIAGNQQLSDGTRVSVSSEQAP